MTRQIVRYPVPKLKYHENKADSFSIELPAIAEVLELDYGIEHLQLTVLVDPTAPTVTRHFVIALPYQNISGKLTYLSVCDTPDDGPTLYLFETFLQEGL